MEGLAGGLAHELNQPLTAIVNYAEAARASLRSANDGSAELRDDLARTFDAMEDLPERYREVILMRDVLDRPAAETCTAMDLSQANQRVLLHRARGRVRSVLADLVAS